MSVEKEAAKQISMLKPSESLYFNMFQGGGAVCWNCNGVFLLFEVPLYGGEERYSGTYYENQINDLVTKAYSWT